MFLEIKKFDLGPHGYRRYLYHYKTCADALGEMPVTHINYAVLEDLNFELSARLAPKTVYDTFGFSRTFLTWCLEREELKNLPRFPKLSKKMGMRKILDKSTQTKVLEKVYEMYWTKVPRARVGIELLCTYPKIRPGELRQVQKKHIDLKNATLTIPTPKKQDDPKVVKLLGKKEWIMVFNLLKLLLIYGEKARRFAWCEYLFIFLEKEGSPMVLTIGLYRAWHWLTLADTVLTPKSGVREAFLGSCRLCVSY